MRYSSHGRFRQQFRFLSRQFLQDGDLPLSNVFSEKMVSDILEALEFCWVDRIYTPLVTLWVFMSQVLSADHSCRAAVARLISHRLSQGESPCSPESGGYCVARKRLPEKLFSEVARQTGQTLDANADSDWLWKGRPVYIFDGSTVTMPDTAQNQAAYPQIPNQKPGLGFPIARIAAVFSLSCGTIVDLAITRGIHPRTISFKGAIQTLEAFQPVIALRAQHDSALRTQLFEHMLKCVATHRVADRPDRFEPRKRKRRNKWHEFLSKPRNETKRDILKGVRTN